MENNQAVELLREIRDLQKLHLEKYGEALKNQQEAMAFQRKASRWQHGALLVIVIFAILLLGGIYLPSMHP